MNFGGSARAFGIDTHDDNARTAALDGHRLQSEPQIATRDSTVRFEPRCDPPQSDRGNYQNAPTRTEHGHAESLSGGIQGKAACGGPAQSGVEFDTGVDLPTAHGLPRSPRQGH